ncbi:MAG: protein kinase, partial [Planctomycetia bacterium]|nr:protein kinase [Planctomycetia bacterium]
MNFDTLNDQKTHEKNWPKLTSGLLIGQHQDYRLKEKLGEGGMGQVWLATQIKGGKDLQDVVCKLLPHPIQAESEDLEKIEKEFHRVKNLAHPGICLIYGLEYDPHFGWFFVMEYANGGTLAEWFKKQENHENGLPLETVIKILRPIADALDFAHEKKVVHRDIKPENIMFFGNEPKIIDFGISASIHETKSMTSCASSSTGTPGYMPPEQLNGEKNQGPRTDQYSLAVIAYEFLAGHPLYTGSTFAIMNQALTKIPPPLSQVPAYTNVALLKALEKKPTDRFATCTEFIDALTTPVVMPPPLPEVVKPKAMDMTWIWGLVTLFVLILVAVFSSCRDEDVSAVEAVELEPVQVVEPEPAPVVPITPEPVSAVEAVELEPVQVVEPE